MRDLVSDGDARAIMDESITSQVSYIVVCELGLCDMWHDCAMQICSRRATN